MLDEYIEDSIENQNSVVITSKNVSYQKTEGTHGGSTELKMAGENHAGVQRQEASKLTVADLLNSEAFNFTVGKYNISDDFAPANRRIKGRKHLVREDNGAPFGLVPSTYHPMQNQTAIQMLEPLEKKGLGEIAKAGSLEGGRKVWVIMKMLGREIQPIQGDSILGYWMLKFNHGEAGEKIHLSPISIRLACENGMISFDTMDMAIDFTRDAEDAMQEVIDRIPELESEMSKSEERLKILAETRAPESQLEEYFRRTLRLPWEDPQVLNKIDAIEDVMERDLAMEEFYKKLARGKRQVQRLFGCYQEEAETLPDANQDSWFQAYNSVTRFTTHISGVSTQNRFRSNWYGQGARTRKAALDLAWDYAVA